MVGSKRDTRTRRDKLVYGNWDDGGEGHGHFHRCKEGVAAKRESGTGRRESGRTNGPHANKVLHHELVKRFRWMGHVYLSFSVPEIGLV